MSDATHPGFPAAILPSQALERLIGPQGEIRVQEPVGPQQIQPASLDLRLGPVAYRVRASFLSGAAHTVADKLDHFAMHRMDISQGAVLEKGCVYIVPLLESLALAPQHSAMGNPKSSTGRVDVFTRLITDYGSEFDRVRSGYHGPLYAEIAPRTFSILVRKGSTLSQLRVRRGGELAADDAQFSRLTAPGRVQPVTVDVRGDQASGLIGYRAKLHAGLIDIDKRQQHAVEDFWEPVYARSAEGLVLDPGEFYILASKEAVAIPPDSAAEMIAYDTLVGEFRVHYAGFFDPGFGYGEPGDGARAVLEVRSYEVPFVLEHGQTVGRLIFEPLTEVPEKLYGGGNLSSNYQRQGLALSKHFKLP